MKSVDAVQETLKKINDIDQSGYQLKSVLAVSDDALEQSHRFDQENSNLPLQGLPILLKDNIEAVGLPASEIRFLTNLWMGIDARKQKGPGD